MESSEFEFDKHSIEIPSIFRSSETGELLSNCMVCNSDLLKEGTSYMIEKAVRQIPEMAVKEVIFEYAMCIPCMMMMQETLSEESKQNIALYFEKNVDISKRRSLLLKDHDNQVEPWVEKCIVKGTPILESPEYQMVGHCDGDRLLFTYMPFVLSMEALDEIANLLSNKSLGEMDDFMGKYFTGPPEVADILRKRPVLII